MTVYCSCCEQWSDLPADGGQGPKARALCVHCTAPLRVEELFVLCDKCGHWRFAEHDGCPVCPTVETETKVADVVEAVADYSTEVQRRKARDGSYYWQLYMEYEPAVPLPASPVDSVEAQPGINGADLNGHSGTVNGSANGYEAEPVPAQPSENGHNGHNGYSPGASNGSNGASSVDLATAESVPMGLFTDEEHAHASSVSDGQVSAGAYNEFEYELIQDHSRLAQVAEMLAQETVLGIDTETTGLDPHTVELLLLQVATPDKVYVVDCKRVLPLALKPLLEDSRILKVAQNAKFEYEMLRQQAGITLSGMYDTMLAERILTAGMGREISLKMIAQKYIGAVLDKSVRESFYKLASNGDAYLAPEQLHYAARDAYIMLPIWQRQVPELAKQKLETIAELEFKCIAAVGDMELAGVKIDEQSWRKIIADVTVQRDRTAAELADLLEPASMQATMFGVPSINLNSNVQLMDAFSKLGVELPDTMESTLVKFDHPAVKKLLEYRAHEKTLSAFGENVLSLINPVTKRIHPDFNQHGADTGRFSCTKPNIQQIPATSDFRKCFVSAEGYKLVTCDYSQAELRILAELSQDAGFVDAFTSGGDLHSLTASQMFGVPLEQVQKPQRNAAKAINFGLAYGMGPGGLAPRLGVSLDEAKELIARYFKAYPGVQKWLDKAARDAVRTGYSVTTLGRKRFYSMPDESLKQHNEDEWRRQIGAIERQGKNSPIQGSNADMTKLALIYLRAALKDWDARTVNTVHDEIVVEAREDQAEEVMHIIEREMMRAGQAILKTVPIVAEAAVADYWSK